MQDKKIVITGGPGTGKSSIITHLEQQGYFCLHEVSREITAEAQKKGIEQLFLQKPIMFSEKLLEARIEQHKTASENPGKTVFLDRGIPDILAYMDFFDTTYPDLFRKATSNFRYDKIFLLPPWEIIYKTDNERYESFQEARIIYNFLKKTYLDNGYSPIEVPLESVETRCDFILNHIHD